MLKIKGYVAWLGKCCFIFFPAGGFVRRISPGEIWSEMDKIKNFQIVMKQSSSLAHVTMVRVFSWIVRLDGLGWVNW